MKVPDDPDRESETKKKLANSQQCDLLRKAKEEEDGDDEEEEEGGNTSNQVEGGGHKRSFRRCYGRLNARARPLDDELLFDGLGRFFGRPIRTACETGPCFLFFLLPLLFIFALSMAADFLLGPN